MNMRPRIVTPETDARPAVTAPHEERGFQPRGLRREDAAWYLGVSPTKFDDWVQKGLMPSPKKQDGVVIWDRRKLDSAFDALPDRDGEAENPFRD